MQSKINIAIDGYSSCGKSTLAKAMAKALGYIYVDTGAMYRAVTLFAIRNNLLPKEDQEGARLVEVLDQIEVRFQFNVEKQVSEIFLNGENVESEIRTMEVSGAVSPVSRLAPVRYKLVALQQAMGTEKGVVMDGRDIGTVVFPHAALKLFMTARPEVRAQRRFAELQAKGQTVSLEEVQTNLEERDYIDTHRKVSPLRQAQDAVVIDNSELTQEAQLQKALQLVKDRLPPVA